MKIGVMDSGIGGIAVLELLQRNYKSDYFYVFDRGGMPYGSKSCEEIRDRVFRVCDFLIGKGVDVIVIACNTASCVAISDCKKRYKIPILGVIPPLFEICKYASTAILCTPLTAKILEKSNFSSRVQIIPQPNLAEYIEKPSHLPLPLPYNWNRQQSGIHVPALPGRCEWSLQCPCR